MTASNRSEFVDLIKPLGERLNVYDPTKSPTEQPQNDAIDPPRAVPQGFIDAMTVREEVFVNEQKVALEKELDEDDARSYHWVAYASLPAKAITNGNVDEHRSTNSTKIPIGTIRLVPPPHPPHPGHEPNTQHIHSDNNGNGDSKEAYIKLGRLAVIKEFRKAGISKLLIETALAFAREHPHEVGPQLDPSSMEALKRGTSLTFRGLVVLHAQTGVQKVWKKHGFETDDTAGHWDEEGMDHVLMCKRLDVTNGGRKSKVWLAGLGPLHP